MRFSVGGQRGLPGSLVRRQASVLDEIQAVSWSHVTGWECYNCIYGMQYEWDEEKNRINQEKHGISFQIAALVFEDERCVVLADRIDDAGEQRWHAVGAASIEPGAAVVLLVVHV